MSRKYRQRGYMDYDQEDHRGMRRDDDLKGKAPISSVVKILKCVKCRERNEIVGKIKPASECSRCETALHSCAHCEYFDLKADRQCQKSISIGVDDKEAANNCDHYSPKLEKDPSLNRPMTEEEARRALNRLFKL